MSDELKPRRSRLPEAPEPVSGYRQTRRGSTSSRSARRAERQHRVATVATRGWLGFKNVLTVIVQALALIGGIAILLLLIANGVNTFARWNARKIAHGETVAGGIAADRENVVVIAVEGENAVGYIAMRVDQAKQQVYGVSIPPGAFIDVPGRGFDRICEAYKDGTDIVMATVSNYFTVQFRSYIVVPKAAYTQAMKDQSVSGLIRAATDSNLSPNQVKALDRAISRVDQKNVFLVPMPVKPIKLGDQMYYEPKRDQIADLLRTWWRIDASQGQKVTRVIIYNGAGIPGIAGVAAQQLIRSGFRVVDTKNADSFGYKSTLIVVKRGDRSQGDAVRQALGTGRVGVEPTNADVTDVIVTIGKDYKPPTTPKEKK